MSTLLILFRYSVTNISFTISGQTYVLIEYHGHTASLPESLTGHIKAIGRAVKSLYFVGKCATPTGK